MNSISFVRSGTGSAFGVEPSGARARRFGQPREQFRRRAAGCELRADERSGRRADDLVGEPQIDPFVRQAGREAGLPRDPDAAAAAQYQCPLCHCTSRLGRI